MGIWEQEHRPIDGRPLTNSAEFIEFETCGQNRNWRPNTDYMTRPVAVDADGYALSPMLRRPYYGEHHWDFDRRDLPIPYLGRMLQDFSFDTRKIPEIEKQCQECRNYHGQTWGGNRLVCGMYPMGNESQCSDFEPKPDELARP